MHRVVQDRIERMVAHRDTPAGETVAAHLAECSECSQELAGMREHAVLLRQLRPPQTFEAEPRAGFYARVMERIEAEGPVSIWNLFMESPFGRRIAVASLALAVVLGVYLVSSEHTAEDPIIAQIPAADFREQVQGAQGDLTVQVNMGPGGVQLEQSDPWAPGAEADLVSGQLPIVGASLQQGDDAVLSNLMSYREQ